MDAFGNLTSTDEFSDGRRVRLISYLGEDVAIGIFGDSHGNSLGVRLVSNGSPELSIFQARKYANPTGNSHPELFSLAHSGSATWINTWDAGDPIRINEFDNFLANAEPALLGMKFVDGCWFELNWDGDEGRVADCSGSATNQQNPILWFDANGGDNQKWRAATIGPGLSISSSEPLSESFDPQPALSSIGKGPA